MKTSVATTLSIAGVLAAGGAAFALNSAVLSDGTAGTLPLAPQTTVVTAAPDSSATPGGQVTAVDESMFGPQATKVSDTVTTYKVATAGSVIVDTATGTVSVTDIVPAAGWTAEPARTEAGGLVKVHFSNGTTRIEFTAQMKNGSVTVNAISDLQPSPATMPSSGTASGAKPTLPRSVSGGDDDEDSTNEHHDGHGEHEDDDDD